MKNNKISKSKKIDPERETRVLLEEIRQEVKTIAEGHGIIIGKLNEHANRFEKIDSELQAVKIDVQLLKSDMYAVKSELHTVKSELHTVKMAVLDTNQRVKSIEKKLDNHKIRISKLEEKVLT